MSQLRREAAGTSGLPRVLVVDDEPHIAEGVKVALRRRAEVVCADSAFAALDILAGGAAFQVILTDLRMPGMDGNELLRQVRERFPDAVRLMWSGQADLAAATEAINGGGIFRFILKPCNGPALEDVLLAAIAEHERQERARAAAMEDPLLKIGSRRAFDAALQEVESLMQAGGTASIAMLDVDEFKKYNDTYGHVAGDAALVAVAAALQFAAAGRGRVFRYGGEELAIIAEADASDTASIAEQARVALENARMPHKSSRHGHLTFSGGVAAFSRAAPSAVERADAALYEAKTSGRNRIVVAP